MPDPTASPSRTSATPGTPAPPPAVVVEGLKKSFGSTLILKNVSLTVEQSELTVIVGPSGCGKTTFLRCLNGLETFDEGRIDVAGITLDLRGPGGSRDAEVQARIRALRLRAGMVFQSFNLFPHLTVIENVMKAPQVVSGMPGEQARSLARGLLDKVGLGEKADLYPVQLSGGQQQRVAIARSLAMQPAVMLYDEPTSALDPALVDEVLAVMRALDDEGMTQIVVTHEMRFARQVADRIVVFHGGEIVESGPPDVIFTMPRDERTRQFLKSYL
ncbi:MAG: amino acid ABC transporter ATP-binding protein [Candidatus Riflebacteria bacterium]|nr:amino acid ABC transporter ATP-binding protein [Candidatus Riflebacteria bacterium]